MGFINKIGGTPKANIKAVSGVEAAAGGSEVLGVSTGSSTHAVGADTLVLFAMFTPTQTGRITNISLYGSNGNSDNDIKLGLYVNSAGTPGALAAASVEFTGASVGTWTNAWKNFTVDMAVTASVSYWLALNQSTGSSLTLYYDALSAYCKYKTVAYANAWPDPAGTVSNLDRQYRILLTNTWP